MYDILLLNVHRQIDLAGQAMRDWLGIHHLAAFLEENGWGARAFTGFAHEAEDVLEREISAFGVSVVGLTCDYENKEIVARLARRVRERWNLPVVVGGPQAAALGGEFLRESGALAVVRGEGELPLLALMQHILDGSGELGDIPGLCFLDGDAVVRTPDQEPIRNLDALPFLDPSLALDGRFQRETASFLTARGCPFNCAFCYEGGNTRHVRRRSVENVMAEVRRTLDRNPAIRFILFVDDTFTLDAKRVLALAGALAEYRRERDFGWFAEAHVQTLLRHPEILPPMIGAGLTSLQIGVESGEERILRAYRKRNTPAQVEEAVRLCRDAGLPHMVANIIVGGAHETRESFARSLEFGLRLMEIGRGMLEIHAVHFWPLPGTAMTLRPQDFGMEIVDPESLTAATDYPVVRCGDLGPEELSGMHAEMAGAFHDALRRLTDGLSGRDVLRILAPWRRYGFQSGWTQAVLERARLRRFACMHFDGAVRWSHGIPPEELAGRHPQRLGAPVMRDGGFFLEDLPLDADEWRVIVASAGRMDVSRAAAHCGMPAEDFLRIARSLEKRMALAFCRW